MEKMSPERVVQLLKNHGVVVSFTEAQLIIDFFEHIAVLLRKAEELNMLQKPVLSFDEACRYLDLSPSHLYKLTSQKQIPHFCPQGKKLYFKREEIDSWLLRNRKSADDEIEQAAVDYVVRNRRGRRALNKKWIFFK